MKKGAIISNGHGDYIRLRDSVEGNTVLVMLETATAKVWVWIDKKVLKTFVDEYLKEE